MKLLVDVIGWLGAVGVLVAYAAVSTRRVSGTACSYQVMNAGGSIGLLVNTLYYGAYPSTVVNAIWLGIAFYALARSRKQCANNRHLFH